MYHRQYLHAATNGVWGTAAASCGGEVLVKQDGQRIEVRPVLCDTWACALCGPRRAAWLKRELRAVQARHGLDWFVTLTIGTENCTPEESDMLITKAWDKLQHRIKRKHGPLSYIWTREHTQQRMAHLHLLMNVGLDQVWLSDAWLECTGGSFIVKVEPVESQRAGDYLAKYCVQQARDRAKPEFAHLDGRRFFSKSRDIRFAAFRGEPERFEATNEHTGEIVQESGYRRLAGGYWGMLATYVAQGWKTSVQRVQGVPFAVLERGGVVVTATPDEVDEASRAAEMAAWTARLADWDGYWQG